MPDDGTTDFVAQTWTFLAARCHCCMMMNTMFAREVQVRGLRIGPGTPDDEGDRNALIAAYEAFDVSSLPWTGTGANLIMFWNNTTHAPDTDDDGLPVVPVGYHFVTAQFPPPFEHLAPFEYNRKKCQVRFKMPIKTGFDPAWRSAMDGDSIHVFWTQTTSTYAINPSPPNPPSFPPANWIGSGSSTSDEDEVVDVANADEDAFTAPVTLAPTASPDAGTWVELTPAIIDVFIEVTANGGGGGGVFNNQNDAKQVWISGDAAVPPPAKWFATEDEDLTLSFTFKGGATDYEIAFVIQTWDIASNTVEDETAVSVFSSGLVFDDYVLTGLAGKRLFVKDFSVTEKQPYLLPVIFPTQECFSH